MYTTHLHALEHYLDGTRQLSEPQSLYQPISYILSMGGKRIRPLLCLFGYEMFDDDYAKALPQAAAIEMFHNFTLMHDDIMDEAPVRRGKPTVHQTYGVNSAILSGDALLIKTYQMLIKALPADRVTRTLDLFSTTALQICEGQQYDMDFEGRNDVSIDEYLQMIKYKTAVLLGASLALGAIRAGADKQAEEALYHCGVAIGMSFQIQDDYLDVFGDSSKTGKQKGGDILQNKKTLLYLKALELAGPREQAELQALYQVEDPHAREKVSRVIQIYQALEVESHCQTLQNSYLDESFQALDQLDARQDKKQALWDIFVALHQRQH